MCPEMKLTSLSDQNLYSSLQLCHPMDAFPLASNSYINSLIYDRFSPSELTHLLVVFLLNSLVAGLIWRPYPPSWLFPIPKCPYSHCATKFLLYRLYWKLGEDLKVEEWGGEKRQSGRQKDLCWKVQLKKELRCTGAMISTRSETQAKYISDLM